MDALDPQSQRENQRVRVPVEEGLTVEGAVEHLVGAARGVVQDQVELVRLKVESSVARVLRGMVGLASGSVLLLITLVVLVMAGYAALPLHWPPVVRFLVVAAATGFLGAILAAWGVHRMRAEPETERGVTS